MDDTEQNIPLKYVLGRESRYICLERYEAGPETANPSQGGILSHRLHAFDGAGRSCVALGKLVSQ